MRQQWGKRLLSLAVAGAMALSVPLGVLADTYDLSKGDIVVTVEKRDEYDSNSNSIIEVDDVWVKQMGKDKNSKEVEYLSEEASKDVDPDNAGTDEEPEQVEVPEESTPNDNSNLTNIDSSQWDSKELDEKLKENEIKKEAKEENNHKHVYDKVKGLLQKTKLVIKQSDSETSTDNTISIKAGYNTEAEVKLDDVNIDTSNEEKAAITVETGGNATVTLELDGDNVVKSGDNHAGVEKIDTNTSKRGTLVIQDEEDDDDDDDDDEDNGEQASLTAQGGENGAGIGGGNQTMADNIKILSGKITAIGGEYADGIGNGRGSLKASNSSSYPGCEYYGYSTYLDAAHAKNIVIADAAEVFALGRSASETEPKKAHSAVSCDSTVRSSNIGSVLEIQVESMVGHNFAVIDAETGEIVRRFTLPEDITFDEEDKDVFGVNIAFDLPKNGNYFVVNTNETDNAAILLFSDRYGNNPQNTYEFEENSEDTASPAYLTLTDKETVTYQFVSDTGAELPQAVLDQKPQAYEMDSGNSITFEKFFRSSFDSVKVDGGRWEFQHWTLNAPGQTAETGTSARKVRGPFRSRQTSKRDINMYGIWTFIPDEQPVEPAERDATEAGDIWYWVTALFNEDENVGYTYEMDGANLVINTDEQAYGAVLHVLLQGWAEHTEVQSITFVTAGKTTTLYASDMLALTTGEELKLTHDYEKATLTLGSMDYTERLGEQAA